MDNQTFKRVSLISQDLKDIIRNGDSYIKLSPSQREALDMMLLTMSCIVNGGYDDPNYWLDISEYGKLIKEQLDEQHPF